MKASIAAYSIFSLFDFLRKPLIPQFILALSWSPLLENVQPDIKKAIGRPSEWARLDSYPAAVTLVG